jgi:glycerol uptake facilitator-like aquaporin
MLIHGLSEFFGTALLIGTIAMTSNMLIIFVIFAIAVFITGPISGGHLNPAVTLWAFLSGKIGGTRAIHHVIAQLLAAVSVYLIKSRM